MEQGCENQLENLSTAECLHDEYKSTHNTDIYKKKKKTVLETEFFKPKYCVDRDSVTACRCHGRPPEFGSPSMLEEGPPAGTSHSVDTGFGKA